tara:strand:- start:34 stop:1362 length:1329 start_codon:yes stop_codon:yes gene_type:complete
MSYQDSVSSKWQDWQALDYINSYEDLRNAFGSDAEAGRRHFYEYGQSEGRNMPATLRNVDRYQRHGNFAGRWSGSSRFDRYAENIHEQSVINQIDDFLKRQNPGYRSYAEQTGTDVNAQDWMRHGAWEHKSNKWNANIYQRDAIQNIENYLAGTDWGGLGYEGLGYIAAGPGQESYSQSRSMEQRMAENRHQQLVLSHIENFLSQFAEHESRSRFDDTIESIHQNNTNAFNEAIANVPEAVQAVEQPTQNLENTYQQQQPNQAVNTETTDFENTWNQRSQELTQHYENLRNQAASDHEAQLLEQAESHERRRLDAEAMWSDRQSSWNEQANVYQSQIDESLSQLGVMTGNMQALQDSFNYERDAWGTARDTYEQAIRAANEQVIAAQDRARVSASYGSQGRPLNREVATVRSAGEPTAIERLGTGAKETFNRKGLRIQNLNI